MSVLHQLGPAVAIGIAIVHHWWLPVGSDAFVLAIVLSCFVVPHGALDALSLRGPFQWVAYLFLFAIVLVGWSIAPLPSLVLFFLVTVVHFAQGDAAAMAVGQHTALRAMSRGLLPLALPGVFYPDEYLSAIRLVLESLHVLAEPELAWVVPLSCAATGLSILTALAAARRATVVSDVVELVAIGILFALAPPLLAIGLYLALWHGWRHGLRISSLRTGHASLAGLAEALRASWPVVSISVVGFLAVICFLAWKGVSPTSVLGPTLALLASLTIPHVVVVSALDFKLADAGAPLGRH